MIKNVLAITLIKVSMKRTFNFARDTYYYRWDKLYVDTIKKVMLVKHAHQKEMINEILFFKIKLKKMEDGVNNNEYKKYVITMKKKLI